MEGLLRRPLCLGHFRPELDAAAHNPVLGDGETGKALEVVAREGLADVRGEGAHLLERGFGLEVEVVVPGDFGGG